MDGEIYSAQLCRDIHNTGCFPYVIALNNRARNDGRTYYAKIFRE